VSSARSYLVDVAIILALALVALAGYKFSPLLIPKADLTLMPVAGCDLHRQACMAEVPGGGRIGLEIAPHPIPVVQPMHITMTLANLPADKVEVDFAGETMNMGFNRVELKPEAEGRYVGEATIPVCVTGRMTWKATVLVEGAQRRIAVPFLFDAPISEN